MNITCTLLNFNFVFLNCDESISNLNQNQAENYLFNQNLYISNKICGCSGTIASKGHLSDKFMFYSSRLK